MCADQAMDGGRRGCRVQIDGEPLRCSVWQGAVDRLSKRGHLPIARRRFSVELSSSDRHVATPRHRRSVCRVYAATIGPGRDGDAAESMLAASALVRSAGGTLGAAMPGAAMRPCVKPTVAGEAKAAAGLAVAMMS